MILHLTILLLYQLGGEVAARVLGLPLPGPVIGMAALFISFVLFPKLGELIQPTTKVLLAHLSLLFVPAGVGVVGHLDKLATHGTALAVAIIGSTLLTILAGVGTFLLVGRLTGVRDE